MSLFHGGDLQSASEEFDIPVARWVDLSTGINPDAYPVGDIDPVYFQNLPYIQPDFLKNVERYYGCANFLPIPGTQSIIQALPECLERFPVILPELGYQEHQSQWCKSGAALSFYNAEDSALAIGQIEQLIEQNPRQHLLIINPNNPSTMFLPPELICSWARRLAGGAYVIVDEAFIDLKPEDSLLSSELPDNCIVLRSFGKFFGLAGIRAGFVFANAECLKKLKQKVGLWSINGPAQALVSSACADTLWQQKNRGKILSFSQFTRALFEPVFNSEHVYRQSHNGLFSTYWMSISQVERIFEFFASQGVLMRVIPVNATTALLRVGVINPAEQGKVERLSKAINAFLASSKYS